VAPSLWIAELIISPEVRRKIDGKHNISWQEIRDALVCVSYVGYVWNNDPIRGRRALAVFTLRGRRWTAVLYPVDDPSGDVYALITAYPEPRRA
jgi:hypothetical protein